MRTLALPALALVLLACSGAPPEAAAPVVTATAEAAVSAAPTAAPAPPPPPPLDPLLAGMTGEDLEWGKKCLDGDGAYCTRFGNVKEMKDKDFAGALTWYKKGCEATKKEAVCCMGQARLVMEGKGVAADVAAGLKIWNDACALPNRDACGELARGYDKGMFGLKKDAKKAKELWGKACDLRDLTACKKAGKQPPKE
jgi:hypothetical protein